MIVLKLYRSFSPINYLFVFFFTQSIYIYNDFFFLVVFGAYFTCFDLTKLKTIPGHVSCSTKKFSSGTFP